MAHLVLSMTMTADGFFSGPNGELDWMTGTSDTELNEDTVSFFDRFDSGFMGYPTASGMIPYWLRVANDPAASAADKAMANAVNRLHPIVVSNQHETLDWRAATLLVTNTDADLVHAVMKAKQASDRDLGLAGGIRTARTFIRLGLVDEYVLTIHPVAIGTGQKIFTNRRDLRLRDSKTYTSGVIRVIYEQHRVG